MQNLAHEISTSQHSQALQLGRHPCSEKNFLFSNRAVQVHWTALYNNDGNQYFNSMKCLILLKQPVWKTLMLYKKIAGINTSWTIQRDNRNILSLLVILNSISPQLMAFFVLWAAM